MRAPQLVLADEAAFKQELAQDQAATKQREDNARKVQAKVNHERGQNAQRKLEKMGGREWDSAKADDWSPGQGQGRRPPPRCAFAFAYTSYLALTTCPGSGLLTT